ncbi:efflux transporter outer membrane subunit [Ideonella sp.]|uniref:efflux transporter outer membrane subunit n=1 Tax=Ideonella sp. TaxID=1929293 RepID=UPI0035B08570
MSLSPRALALLVSAAGVLAGCASPGALRPDLPAAAPVRWHAPLPHAGDPAAIAGWWARFDDPLLARLVDAAQAASPTLAAAQARLAEARAARTAAGARLLPTLDASASLSRGRAELGTPIANTAVAGLQAGWELDLFGGAQAGRAAAGARLAAAEAGWHDARVVVAAETAQAYVALRACEALRQQAELDATSRDATARLTQEAARVGFQAPATAALADASAAQARAQAVAQAAQCQGVVKSLVALTALDEAALAGQLAERTARLPAPAALAVDSVPAQALGQRPDLAMAGWAVEAAAAEVQAARADRWPRITLAGSVSRARVDFDGGRLEGNLWTLGPLAVSLPVFDAGTRAAQVDAASARYDEALAAWRGSLRQAVREVETALVQLDSTASRAADAQRALDGFEASLRATEARHLGGLASLFELEDARRSAAAARSQWIALQQERLSAWVTLYRALGGGWTADGPPPAPRPVAAAS